MSFPLLLIFLFATFSACFEVIPFVAKLRPLLIVAIFGLLAVGFSGRIQNVMSARVTWAIGLFTLWFVVCIPLGVWPGGSFFVFTEYWYKSALLYVMIAGLLTTVPQARRVFITIAYAAGFLAIVTLLKNGQQFGRLVLIDTRYANPNDLAWTLIIGLAFLGYLYMRGNVWQKGAAIVLAGPLMWALLKTGSRSGSLGVGVFVVSVFWQAKKRTKIRMLVALPVIAVGLLLVVPREMRLRYTTYFGEVDPSEYGTQRYSTLNSTEARTALLKDSLRITAAHPIFGVGPGNFPVAQNDLAQARGEKPMWHVTHNTYTELSSEMGVPGLLLYVWMIVLAFKILNSIIRVKASTPVWRELRLMALTLRATFWAFLVVAFFASLAYNTDVPILVGIATALGFMAQQQRTNERTEEARIQAQNEPVVEQLEPIAVGQY